VQFLVNDDATARAVLAQRGYASIAVDLNDTESNWEGMLIEQLGIRLWINDRLDTSLSHARHLKQKGLPLVTFDDRGDGAALADLHLAALAFDPSEPLAGRRVIRGPQALILNPQIATLRRVRTQANSLLVTLGGSDTWGATVKVVKILAQLNRPATVVVGPSFQHHQALNSVLTHAFSLECGVTSMVEEMACHDLAVTGGGITPFEANAAGLPCIVVANEPFEIPVGKALEQMGGAVFAGHHDALDESVFARDLPIETMSLAAMRQIGLNGLEHVADAVEELVLQ
jgi:spore coat polysaccharide biosynthesis predicted glycosyltransferase SpsG